MRSLCVMTLLVFGPTALADPSDDGTVAKLLIGKWSTCVTGGSATEPDGTIRYDKAGGFKAEGEVKLGGGETADVRVEGTWKVEYGSILHRVSKSSHPGLAPVGGELREQLLEITEKAMRVKRGVGMERERKRLAE